VIGTSLGGAFATYLAAAYPDQIAGLILFSPFYDFVGLGKLIDLPGGLAIARAVEGPVRDASQPKEIGPRVSAEYAQHWYVHQYTSSLRIVRDSKRFIARPELFARVRCPVLLLYDAADDVASVPAMLAAFETFQRQPASRSVAIAYGNHILASAHLETDKPAILRETRRFLEALRAAR